MSTSMVPSVKITSFSQAIPRTDTECLLSSETDTSFECTGTSFPSFRSFAKSNFCAVAFDTTSAAIKAEIIRFFITVFYNFGTQNNRMSTERELILLCRTKIEQLLNWGDSVLWTNSDFELLSDKIFEKTVVRLSISTLKRIWGKVKYDNSPTAATLNALANFLDYASWRDFESEQTRTAPVGHPVESINEINNATAKPRRWMIPRRMVPALTMIAVVAASVVVVLLLVKGRSPHRFDPALAVFKHREVTDDLPNSVVFDCDVSAYDADSAFIQQNWDPRRREKVPLDLKQHTSIYYEPGYFM